MFEKAAGKQDILCLLKITQNIYKCMCTCVHSFKWICASWSDTTEHVPETRGSVIQDSLGSCQLGESERLPKQHRLFHCSQSLKVTPCWWQHVVQTQCLEESSWIWPRNCFLIEQLSLSWKELGSLPVEKMTKIPHNCTTYTWQQWPERQYIPKGAKVAVAVWELTPLAHIFECVAPSW